MADEVLEQAPQAAPEAAPQAPAQKMLTQDEVNYIVSKRQQEAYQKGLAQGQTQAGMIPQAAQQQASGALTEAQIKEIIATETSARVQAETSRIQEAQAKEFMTEQANKIVEKFSAAMQLGVDKHDDFKEVVGSLRLDKVPQLVDMVHNLPNADEIMYELGNKPEKYQLIKSLIKDEEYAAANKLLAKLANSIAVNEKAKVTSANLKPPLSPVKPSAVSNPKDGPSYSLEWMKKQPWARR